MQRGQDERTSKEHKLFQSVRVIKRMKPFYLPYRVATGGGEQRRFEPENMRPITVNVSFSMKTGTVALLFLVYQEEGENCQD